MNKMPTCLSYIYVDCRKLGCLRNRHATCFALVLCGIAFLCSGCANGDGDVVPVSGLVLINDEPLTAGNIRFVPKSGRPASAAINDEGKFQLAAESIGAPARAGVPRGKYQVQVSASRIVDDQTIEWMAPAHYADFRTSRIEVTIDKPTDDLTIRLTGKKDAATNNFAPEQPLIDSNPAADEKGKE